MKRDELAAYLNANFELHDRLAVVLINKRAGSVIQRLMAAEQIATASFQSWLRQENRMRYDVYLSMNALHTNATGRRKQDIETIRHVYLDFDHDADGALKALFERRDIPAPHYTVHTSPTKWHAIWRVHHFDKEQAEQLQRGLSRQTGADAAATDCARVLRVPFFYNHKYGTPHWVEAMSHVTGNAHIYRPEEFPEFLNECGSSLAQRSLGRRPSNEISQSERDWAYAKRALERGDQRELVIAAVASYRRYDKYDPQYYARLTVEKAAEALRKGKGQPAAQTSERHEIADTDRSLPSR